MYKAFLEIAFEAELNTKEDPEMLEAAEKICNEYQDTRAAAITQLRKMIFEREECCPRRMDDEFLLRFLRARYFIVPKAHKLLVRYCNFREEHSQLYDGVDLWGLTKAKAAYECTMTDHPDTGRLMFIRFGTWDPYEVSVEALLSAGLAMIEIGMRNPKIQVVGSTAIIDLEGIATKHVTAMTPTAAYQIVNLIGLGMPNRVKSYHVINYSWVMTSFFFIFKRFIPQYAWDAIHFHGNDLKSLQQHFSLEHLPPRYGGTCRTHYSYEEWLSKIRKYRDESFDQEMKTLGYVVKE